MSGGWPAGAVFWHTEFVAQVCPRQSGSAQSTRPSQSLSTPSPQEVSLACARAGFPPGAQTLQRPAAEQVLPLRSQARPGPPPGGGLQLGSAQSMRPLQSLSLPSPQEVSVAWATPPLPEQAQVPLEVHFMPTV